MYLLLSYIHGRVQSKIMTYFVVLKDFSKWRAPLDGSC